MLVVSTHGRVSWTLWEWKPVSLGDWFWGEEARNAFVLVLQNGWLGHWREAADAVVMCWC